MRIIDWSADVCSSDLDGRTGDYRLILVTDAGETLFENFAEGDNVALSPPIHFAAAAAADLTVESIIVPEGEVPGETVDVIYVVRNIGSVAAAAPWTDRTSFHRAENIAIAGPLTPPPPHLDLAPEKGRTAGREAEC